MPKKKKDTWRQTINAGKRESFKDWSIIQKGLLLIFLIGAILAVLDMSCGKKEETKPASATNKLT